MEKINLVELIDVSVLQAIQDGFSAFTGMAALTTDADGVAVTEGSGFTDFCMNLTRKSAVGVKRCEQCDKNGAIITLETGKPAVYDCHAGLVDFAAPIMVDGTMVGSFIGGQIRIGPVCEEKMRVLAKEMDIDPDVYIEALNKTNITDKHTIEKAAAFLTEIAKVLSEMAYRNYRALRQSMNQEKSARSQSEFFMNISSYMHRNVESWLGQIQHTKNSDDIEMIKRTMNDIWTGGNAVLAGVENMTEYLRMTGGEETPNEESYNVREMIGDIVEKANEYKEDKDIQIVVDISDDIPKMMMGDSARITQVVLRLLQNSIRLNEAGTINLNVTYSKMTYATILGIEIRNNAVDISEKKLVEIQGQLDGGDLYQTDLDEDMEHGLPVIGVLVKQMFGKVDAIRLPEGGSKFVVSLPQLEIQGGE